MLRGQIFYRGSTEQRHFYMIIMLIYIYPQASQNCPNWLLLFIKMSGLKVIRKKSEIMPVHFTSQLLLFAVLYLKINMSIWVKQFLTTFPFILFLVTNVTDGAGSHPFNPHREPSTEYWLFFFVWLLPVWYHI